MVILALAIGALTGSDDPGSNPASGALPALTPAAPPHATAEEAPCAKVLEQLPVQLNGLDPRRVHPVPDSPYVVAWGDPAVILACGVDRPKSLEPGSSVQFLLGGTSSGPYYDVTRSGSDNVWTTVDRGPYISITVPAKYQGADVLPPLSAAIAKALPPVCDATGTAADVSKLCTRRR